MAPQPSYTYGKSRGGPSDWEKERYWFLEGEKAQTWAMISREEGKMRSAEKAAGSVPKYVALILLGLVIWGVWFYILFRVVPRAKKTLVIVSTEDLKKLDESADPR